MSHWAEIDENNVVLRVLVGDNDDPTGDEGYQWIIDNLGGTWIKTSYNAIGGKRRDPNTGEILNEPGFRKNYAGVGYTYDLARDAFIPPKPEPVVDPDVDIFATTVESNVPYDTTTDWVLNEQTCLWEKVTASE